MKEDLSIMFEKEKFNFRVGAIIEYKNKILLQKNENLDFYNIPGGRVKIGESTLDAIKREIEEELGIKETNYILFHVLENFFTFNNTKTHELLFVYKLKLEEGHPLTLKDKISAKDRIEEINYWVNKEDSNKLNCKPISLHQIINKKTHELTTSVEIL